MSGLKELAACAAGVELGSSPAAPAILFKRIHKHLWILDSGCEAISGRFRRERSG